MNTHIPAFYIYYDTGKCLFYHIFYLAPSLLMWEYSQMNFNWMCHCSGTSISLRVGEKERSFLFLFWYHSPCCFCCCFICIQTKRAIFMPISISDEITKCYHPDSWYVETQQYIHRKKVDTVFFGAFAGHSFANGANESLMSVTQFGAIFNWQSVFC